MSTRSAPASAPSADERTGLVTGNRRSLPVRQVLLAATATLVVLGLAGSIAPKRNHHDSDTPSGFACIQFETDPDDGYCDRAATDAFRRRPLPSGTAPVDIETIKLIRSAAANASWCPERSTSLCPNRPAKRTPTALDATAGRQALARLGFTETTVRIALPHDPAPSRALVYAVRIDNVCVVGHVRQVPDGGSGAYSTLGLLPEGRCLP